MGTQRVQIKGILPWLVRWACRAGTRDFWYCLGCSSRPSTKLVFSSMYTISIPLSPSPSKLGRQPCWVACLSSMCLCDYPMYISSSFMVSYISISNWTFIIRGLQRDVVYLGWPIAPSYMSSNARGGGGVAVSQPMCIVTGAQINFGDLTK